MILAKILIICVLGVVTTMSAVAVDWMLDRSEADDE